MPNTFGLNRTLGGAIGTIAVVAALSSGAVLASLQQLNEATENRRRSTQMIRSLDAFRTAMLNQETGLRGHLITGRESSLEPYQWGKLALDESVASLRRLIGTDVRAIELINDAEAAARAWQKTIGEAAIRLAADPATRQQAVQIEAEGRGKAFFDRLREKLSTIENMQETVLIAQNERLGLAQRTATMTLWAGTIITLLICVGIGIATNRLIVRPLIGVMSFVERIGDGDLTGHIRSTGRNEIGRLGATLNTMVDGLARLARTNRSATNELNSAAAEIQASTQEQAASVEEQFAAVQETAATVDEITQSGAQVTQRAREVIAAAQTTAESAHAGLRAVNDTAEAMNAIREQGVVVAGTIAALSDRTQAIGDIIATVNDLSERTHLLALNAAIEAAAAGESGRAFAIVAAEMRLLADQAKQATVQVRAILLEIQRGINSSVMLTEEAVKRATTGKTRTDSTIRTIEEMATRVEQSVETFQQIVASTSQQQIGIEQVMGALTNIRQASQQTAAGTRQVELASANLAALAHGLMGLADRYRLASAG